MSTLREVIAQAIAYHTGLDLNALEPWRIADAVLAALREESVGGEVDAEQQQHDADQAQHAHPEQQ